MTIPEAPTRSAVRKAGSRIRAWSRGESVDVGLLESAFDVVDAHRAQFSLPTSKVATGLRSMCSSLKLNAKVSQRIKRHPTILDKLMREPGLDLSRMHDIGGCRVVLRDQADLRALQTRVNERWRDGVHREIDYIATPRESGYRALHIIVERDGRPIEVQLRDEAMHAWAETVEAISLLTRTNYKRDGDSIVQRFMQLESAVTQDLERGRVLPQDLLDELDTLRAQVLEYVMTSSPERDGEQP